MKFSEFKTTQPSEDVPDPCCVPPTLFDGGGKLIYLNPHGEGFSDEDEILLVQLRLGNCPVCYHRLTQDVKRFTTWHSCSENPNHLWEVDYEKKKITPFEPDQEEKKSEAVNP